MIRTPRKPIRIESRGLSSAAPGLAGAIAAAAFVLGGGLLAAMGDPRPDAPAEAALTEEERPGAAAQINTLSLPVARDVAAAPLRRPQPAMPSSVEEAGRIAAAAERVVSDGPVIAIVIDDAGLDVAAAERAINLPADITLAILPYAASAAGLAEAALASGDEVFVHMPMEPLGLDDPGPGALTRHLGDAELSARVRAAFARVPGASGMNNHMGSAFTSDARALRIALSAMDEDALFLDSVTTGRSRAAAVADGLGLTALSRDIFIDHDDSAPAIAARLEELEALARRDGRAIAIGHPRALTLEALEAWMPEAQARGLRFVTMSAIAAMPEAGESVYAGLNASSAP